MGPSHAMGFAEIWNTTMPVKKRKAKERHLQIKPELRARYAALDEPTYDLHRELGLQPWHTWIVPGFASLEDAIGRIQAELAKRDGRSDASA